MTVKKEEIEVRECRTEEVQKIPEISKKILETLEKEGNEDFFGGVDLDEVAQAMKKPGRVFVATYQEQIIGFALLQPESEIQDYILLNGYGVDPEYQKQGIAKLLLQEVKQYAISKGFECIAGTVHPDNKASISALLSISEGWRQGAIFVHETQDGRKLERRCFSLTLIK